MTKVKIEIEASPEVVDMVLDGIMRTKTSWIDISLESSVQGDGSYSALIMDRVKELNEVRDGIVKELKEFREKGA